MTQVETKRQLVAAKCAEPTDLDSTTPNHEWATLGTVVHGAQCRAATAFRFFRTETALWLDVAAQCQTLTTRFTERNDPLHEDDVVELFLRPPFSASDTGTAWDAGTRYLELQASPAGCLFDAWVTNRTDLKDPAAHRGLELAHNTKSPRRPSAEVLLDGRKPDRFSTADFARGVAVATWKVRFRIPFAGFPDLDCNAGPWMVNVFRIQRSADCAEHQAWCPTGRVDFHRPESFGRLVLES